MMIKMNPGAYRSVTSVEIAIPERSRNSDTKSVVLHLDGPQPYPLDEDGT
jgi:hypothetical protein